MRVRSDAVRSGFDSQLGGAGIWEFAWNGTWYHQNILPPGILVYYIYQEHHQLWTAELRQWHTAHCAAASVDGASGGAARVAQSIHGDKTQARARRSSRRGDACAHNVLR
jgi:hypothetical protein